MAAGVEAIPVFLREGAEVPVGLDGEARPGAVMRSGVNEPRVRGVIRAGVGLVVG